ncbi:MAG: D-tyrosyl-tRNA(Tyr) deacylase [Betaproteobacteria bacterium]|nr:D-tyrosyl-tRNA(Tyr) deacylase [Betaproteobacteria bacterium]
MSLQSRSEAILFSGLRMRTVLQRCRNAEVCVEGKSCGVMSAGVLALVGFAALPDSSPIKPEAALAFPPDELRRALEPLYQRWWDKVSQLRVFSDTQGKMNDSILQQSSEYGFYLVSQFTLFADMRKGNRPSYTNALASSIAKICFEFLVIFVRSKAGERPVYSGIFGTDMNVSFINDGPVTLLFDCSLDEGIVAL